LGGFLPFSVLKEDIKAIKLSSHDNAEFNWTRSSWISCFPLSFDMYTFFPLGGKLFFPISMDFFQLGLRGDTSHSTNAFIFLSSLKFKSSPTILVLSCMSYNNLASLASYSFSFLVLYFFLGLFVTIGVGITSILPFFFMIIL
jgi:hypothetical protein